MSDREGPRLVKHRSVIGKHSPDYLNSRHDQPLGPACRQRVRVSLRKHHARNPSRDERIYARACAPGVVTRLKGDNRRSSTSTLACVSQCVNLSVRSARASVQAFSYGGPGDIE